MFFPEASRLLRAQLLNPDPAKKISGASIDTRTLKPGNFFVALRGNNTDGHQYLGTAFKNGASGALVEEKFVAVNSMPADWVNVIPVADPGAAFLNLAGAFRRQFSPITIGVAGSVGKTSTKEFLKYVLHQKSAVLATEGNLNNQLGLPLTLFRLGPEYCFCVCELGANKKGDVRELTEILAPDHGLLTRIAPEHLEGFGSMEKVYEAEIELFESLKPNSVAVMPDDDSTLWDLVKKLPLQFVKVGLTENADYRVTEIRTDNGWVHFKVNGTAFSFPGLAGFLAKNAAMAIAMADRCGFSIKEIPSRWEGLKLPNGRFQEQSTASGIRVIYDGYNASPASFEAAIESFEKIPHSGKKILVFSDMLEMGTAEREVHEQLGARIAGSTLNQAVAYGPRSRWAVETIKARKPGFKVDYFENSREAASFLGGCLQKDDMILLKGSRGMKVEEILTYLPDIS